MVSPNTPGKLTKNPDAPNDMQRVFDLINGAKQAVLFLAFDPGNNSILDAAGKALAKNPDLFVRGALTNGVTREEIREIFLHVGLYAGAPAMLDSVRIAKEVLAEMDGAKA